MSGVTGGGERGEEGGEGQMCPPSHCFFDTPKVLKPLTESGAAAKSHWGDICPVRVGSEGGDQRH